MVGQVVPFLRGTKEYTALPNNVLAKVPKVSNTDKKAWISYILHPCLSDPIDVLLLQGSTEVPKAGASQGVIRGKAAQAKAKKANEGQ